MAIEKLKRKLYLNGDIDWNSCTNIIEKIQSIEASDNATTKLLKEEYNVNYIPEPITLNINSVGGCCYPAFGLYDIIKTCKTQVNTCNIGFTASAAILIYLAGKERYTTSKSKFVIHQASSMVFGTVKAIEEDLVEAKEVNDLSFSIIKERTNITKKQLNEIYKQKKDWYISGKQSISLGISTKLIE